MNCEFFQISSQTNQHGGGDDCGGGDGGGGDNDDDNDEAAIAHEVELLSYSRKVAGSIPKISKTPNPNCSRRE